jgi:hypothetical protein
MTRLGALESKKRYHDLRHRDSDIMDFLVKSGYFPDEPKKAKVLSNQTRSLENGKRQESF